MMFSTAPQAHLLRGQTAGTTIRYMSEGCMIEDGQADKSVESEKAAKNTGRVEAFSDGVFAIAITLLVLNLLALKLPSPESASPGALGKALGQGWPIYLTYLLSFATILIMWVYHHRLFQSLKRAETSLLFANGFLLLLVTAVPFPTNLVGMYLTTPAASVACAVYAGFFAFIDLAYNLLWWVVARQQVECTHHPVSQIFSWLGFPCYVIAAITAFWLPILTLCICGALWIVWALTAPRVD